ncbi:MAG: hypothetical protein MJ003_04830 [Paludibacteraceae bacterium]|nr:hypothetical protein [Paludibacteraceae bacterium]
MECIVYHTLENRENADEVEMNAPYPCNKKNAWLGRGYYFWESFIDLAKKWGEDSYNGNYFVCQCQLSCPDEYVLDLVGNTRQLMYMQSTVDMLEARLKQGPLTVPFVINYLREKTKFNYYAIRVNGVNSMCMREENVSKWRIKFTDKRKAYLDLMPALQICVIDKKILKLPMKIIYPEAYSDGYVI